MCLRVIDKKIFSIKKGLIGLSLFFTGNELEILHKLVYNACNYQGSDPVGGGDSMKKRFNSVISLLIVMTMVLSVFPVVSMAAEVTYQLRDLNAGGSTEVRIADYQTYETDHFVVIYDTDGANKITESQLSTLGETLENCWALFIDKMGMEPTSTSVHDNGDKTTQYKTNVVVMGTGVDHYYLGAGEWGAYGSVDSAGYPYFMCSVTAITSPTVVAHEFGHAVHYAQGDNAWENNIFLGPWFEAVANWFAEQYIYEYMDSTTTQMSHLYLREGHLTKMNGRGYYEAWPILQYLTEDPDNTGVYGSTFVQKLLSYDSGSTNTLFWEVLEENNGDLTVADTVGMYASHIADLDFNNKSRYDKAINNVMNGSFFWQQRYTMLEEKGEESNTFIVPLERVPQAMGYNVIPLDFTAGSVSVTLNSETDVEGADWRARLVKVNSSGTATYSDLFSDGETMSITASSTDELYLTVAATPALDTMARHTITGWATHSTEANFPYENKTQYPYSVTLNGATPMSRPTPSGTFKTHSNGGGKVAYTASVASSAYVGPNAVVMGYATVSDNAVVDGYAIVAGNATVSGNAYVGDYAVLFDRAEVTDNARVIENACLYVDYTAKDNAVIKGSTLGLYNGTAGGEAVTYGDFFEDAGHTIAGGAFSGYHTANDNTYTKTIQSSYVRPYVVNLRSRYEFEGNLRDTYSYTDLYGVNVEYEDGRAVFDGSNYVILDSSALYYDNSKVTIGTEGTGTALTLGAYELEVDANSVAFAGATVSCSDKVKEIEITLDGTNITLSVNGVESSVSSTTTLTDCGMAGGNYIGKGFNGSIDYVRIYDMGYEYSSTDIGNMEGNFVPEVDSMSDASAGTLNSNTENINSTWYGWSSTSSNVTVDGGLNITGAVTCSIKAPSIETDKFIIEFTPSGGAAYPDHGILDSDGTTVLFAHRYATDAKAIHVGRGETNSSIRGTSSVSDTTGQARLSNFVCERIASGTLRTDRSAASFANGERVRIVAENRVWDATMAEEFAKSENYTDNLVNIAEGDAIYTVTYGILDEYNLFTPVSVSVYTGSFTGFGGFKTAGGTSGVTVSYEDIVIYADAGEDVVIEVTYIADGEKVKSATKRSGDTFPEVYIYENGVNEIYYAEGASYSVDTEVEMTNLAGDGLAVGTCFETENGDAYKTTCENLIANGDFTASLKGWYNSAGGEATSSYFTVNTDGTITAKASTGATGEGSLYRAWDVEIGKTYVFTYTSDVENQYHVVSQKNDISETNDGTIIGTGKQGTNYFVFTAGKEYVQINFRWLGSSNAIGNFGLYEVTSAEGDRVVTTINFKAGNTTIGSTSVNGFKGDVIDLTDEEVVPVTVVYNGSVYTKDSGNAESYTANATGTVTITYTESDIQSIESVSATVIGDNLPVLPTTLTATTSSGTMEVDVEWDYSTLVEGEECTVYGAVEGTVIKAEATVTVLPESFALNDMTSYTSQSDAKSKYTALPLAITGEYYIEMDVKYSSFGDFWITMFTTSDVGFFSKEQVALGHNASGGFRPVNGNGSGGRTTSDTNLTTVATNTNYRILVKADASTDKYTVTITKPDGTSYTATNFGFRRNATSINAIVMFRNGGSSGAATATNIKVYYPGYASASFVTEEGTLVRKISGDVQSGTFTVSETVGFVIDDEGMGHYYQIPETIVNEDITVVVEEVTGMYPVLEDAYVQGTTVYGINSTDTNSVFIAAVGGNDRAPLQDADGNNLRGKANPSTLGTSRVGLFQFPVLELEDGKAAVAHFYVRSWHGNTFANSNDSIRMAGYAVDDDTWLTGTCTAASLTLLEGQTNPMFTSKSTNTVGYITLDITEAMKAAQRMGLDTITIRLNAAWGAAYIAEREAAVAGGSYEGKAAYLTVEDGNYITVAGATKVTKDGSLMSAPEDGVTITEGSSVKMYTDSTDAVAFTNGVKVYPVTNNVTEAITPEAGGYYPAIVGVDMVAGAQVRIGEGVDAEGKAGEGSGLRFVTQLNRADSLATVEGATYGVKITAEGSDADPVDIPAEKWQSTDVFTTAITNLAVTNYNRNFTATPYIIVDGQIFEGTPVTRSIYKVASGILKNGYTAEDNATGEDKTSTEYALTDVLCDVLNAYVNQTGIRLTITSDGTITARETGTGAYTGDLFFDVSRVDNGDGSYTVTITPSENVEIKQWWKEYVRINNNHSSVINMIANDSIAEDGTLTFTFTPVVSTAE